MKAGFALRFVIALATAASLPAEELTGCLERRGETYVLLTARKDPSLLQRRSRTAPRLSDFVGKRVKVTGTRGASGFSVVRVAKLAEQCEIAPGQPTKAVFTDRLWGHWIHSREEDRPGVRVYRPAGYKLPPARGRDGFVIEANGVFTDESIGRGDAPSTEKGKWKRLADDRLEVAGPTGQTKRVLRILSITPDKLEIYEEATDPGTSAPK